jgi:predicted amidophosphoribosyltransferase
MKKACRDCGNELDANARGCPRCAMNAEAEQMIDRFVWRRLVPLLIVILLVGAGAILILRG